jgi:RimJ/RimL family protein N-acetyltransferase
MNEFSTERLLFRSFELEDLERLAFISADEETSRYVGDGQPLSRDLTREWIANSRENVARYGYGTGAVVLRETAELIGWSGIARPDEGGEEILYGLYRDYWGQGLGTELLDGLLTWAWNSLAFVELRATVHRRNVASVRMLENAGFVLADDRYDDDPNTLLYISLPPSRMV